MNVKAMHIKNAAHGGPCHVYSQLWETQQGECCYCRSHVCVKSRMMKMTFSSSDISFMFMQQNKEYNKMI